MSNNHNLIELLLNPRTSMYSYPTMTKTMKGEGDNATKDKNHQFVLHVEEGTFTDSEIVVMLGKTPAFIPFHPPLLKLIIFYLRGEWNGKDDIYSHDGRST